MCGVSGLLPPVVWSETQATSELPACSIARVSELSAFVEQSEVVLDESNGVSFLVSSAEYRYPESAQETIQTVAQSIISSGRHVRVVGQCASDGDQAYRLRLSTARAEQVCASLLAAGVPEENIDEVVGVGTDSEYFVNDLDEQGQLIPALASQNRVVRILYV